MRKYGVDEEEKNPLEKRSAEGTGTEADNLVKCPTCHRPVCHPENYGGLLVCVNCGTAPFERKP